MKNNDVKKIKRDDPDGFIKLYYQIKKDYPRGWTGRVYLVDNVYLDKKGDFMMMKIKKKYYVYKSIISKRRYCESYR